MNIRHPAAHVRSFRHIRKTANTIRKDVRMGNEKISVEIIGLSSKATGAFRVHAKNFSTFLPQYGIDACIYGYTRGSPGGCSKYIHILPRFSSSRHLIYLSLFFIAPFLPIRKKAVIMVNMEQDVIPLCCSIPITPTSSELQVRLSP